MSSMEGKQVNGDMSVTRNVHVGSNVNIRGCINIGHNVKIDGWLDAPNIRGACKGFFLDEKDLKAAYPKADKGDYAFVGNTLPCVIWQWNGKEWSSTDKIGGPDIDVDGMLARVDTLEGSVTTLKGEIGVLQNDVESHTTMAEEKFASIDSAVTEATAKATAATEQSATAKATAEAAKATAEAAASSAAAAKATAEAAKSTAEAVASSAAAAKSGVENLTAEVSALQSDVSVQGDALVSLQSTAADMQKSVSDVQSALTTHKQEAAAKESAMEAMSGIDVVVAFDGIIGNVTVEDVSVPMTRDPEQRVSQGATRVYFSTAKSAFVLYSADDKSYYGDWDNAYLWQRGGVPYAKKGYYNVSSGMIYQYVGATLKEIALSKLQDDIGVMPCVVRNASPSAMPSDEAPSTRDVAVWWSQKDKAFYAAQDYNYDVNGDMIEGCECSRLEALGREVGERYGVKSGGKYVPRTDRLYRSLTQLYRYDASSGQMTALFDISESVETRAVIAESGSFVGNVYVDGDVSASSVKTDTITPSTGSGGVVEVDGTVSSQKMQLGGVDMSSVVTYEFHDILQRVPVVDAAINRDDKGCPKTIDGGVCDIVYIRALKRFVALTESTCYVRFVGDENYNEIDGDEPATAREDRVWRCGNKLYRYDGSSMVCDVEDLKDSVSGVTERVDDVNVLVEGYGDALDEVKAQVAPLALPKIECVVESLIDKSDPYQWEVEGIPLLYVRNAKAYLDAGYVPILFRKTSDRRKHDYLTPDEGENRVHQLIKGWHVCGGQNIVKIGDDDLLMITDADREKWNSATANSAKWTYHADKPELYTNPHEDVYDIVDKETGETIDTLRKVRISWGKSTLMIWGETYDYDDEARPKIQKYSVHTLRFRFAIGFVKPYKQNRWTVTAKDCVSNLAEFAVVWNLLEDEIEHGHGMKGWRYSM